MKFGPVPVARALGCVLAHSVSTEAGRLRKGLVLEQDHITALARSGASEVIAAQLEAGDVDEDAAARALADAMMQDSTGLRATEAATGRVNLVATGPGLARLDESRITAMNDIDPMITCATVPPLHQLTQGTLVATIKIISYAVPRAQLEAACSVGRASVSVHPPAPRRVSLIVTQIPGGAAETKGIDATRARIEALGSVLDHVETARHETDALAAALTQAPGDMILILTGSATSDPHDVGPSGLRAAGGTVIRFGMPVDPGNLLFLGTLKDRPVVGLPGCARSPARNGADLVLGRILCGVPVTNADISAMGVGGLLKEIPTRPRPRRG